MKKIILFEVFRILKSNPRLFKKIKMILAVGFVGIFFVGGVTIWAGISGGRFLMEKANHLMSSSNSQNQIQTIKSQISRFEFQPITCLEKAQGLLSIATWIESPILHNLGTLKSACIKMQSNDCKEIDCSELIQNTTNTEWSTI